jgi:hypothetical protein
VGCEVFCTLDNTAVILSGVATARSAAATESKDPVPACAIRSWARDSHDDLECTERIP